MSDETNGLETIKLNGRVYTMHLDFRAMLYLERWLDCSPSEAATTKPYSFMAAVIAAAIKRGEPKANPEWVAKQLDGMDVNELSAKIVALFDEMNGKSPAPVISLVPK